MDVVSSPVVDRGTVERTIATGIQGLHFPESLEAAFERDVGSERCRQLATGGLFSVLLYVSFAISVWLITPGELSAKSLAMVGIVAAIALAMVAQLFRQPVAWARELLAAFIGVTLGFGGHLQMLLIGPTSDSDAQYVSVISLLLLVAMLRRVRFWYALPVSVACFVVYALVAPMIGGYSDSFQAAEMTMLAFAAVLALVGSYVQEKDARMNYLQLVKGQLQRRDLDAQSRRDPLTGLRNRLSLDEVVEDCDSLRATGQNLSIVLVDIDHFKAFNDTAGHQAGDVCLKRVAGIIQSELRDFADGAFRFGGEEFILVLRGVDLTTAVRISERIRRAIEAAAIPHPALAIGSVVTVSMGIASAVTGGDASVGSIISAADAELYNAKRNGRNQVSPRPAAGDLVDIFERRGRSDGVSSSAAFHARLAL